VTSLTALKRVLEIGGRDVGFTIESELVFRLVPKTGTNRLRPTREVKRESGPDVEYITARIRCANP